MLGFLSCNLFNVFGPAPELRASLTVRNGDVTLILMFPERDVSFVGFPRTRATKDRPDVTSAVSYLDSPTVCGVLSIYRSVRGRYFTVRPVGKISTLNAIQGDSVAF